MINVKDDESKDEFNLIDSKETVDKDESDKNESDENESRNKNRNEEEDHDNKNIASILLRSVKVFCI